MTVMATRTIEVTVSLAAESHSDIDKACADLARRFMNCIPKYRIPYHERAVRVSQRHVNLRP